ncbi:MAG: hypothetical protein J6S22_02195 [Clostridia bacterium]|nr:hypothetical protein [Clostridia bacterium]
MEYLFFDIECACVYKDVAKICAFGYCLTDEKFNILEKEDILINPKGSFHLTDRKGRSGIVLPYDYTDFKNYPPFPKVYSRIRALLEGENRLIFGHATSNDVKYLNLETRRFHLPALEFCFYDTQIVYMTVAEAFDRQYGLEHITQNLNVKFTPHRAADDAYATMRIAEAMCKAEGVGLQELLKKYAVLPGKTAKGKTLSGTSEGIRRHAEAVRLAREERDKNHAEFCRFVDKNRPKKKSPAMQNGKWRGFRFCFSREIENNLASSIPYVQAIYSQGGTYCFKSGQCNVYIKSAGEQGVKSEKGVQSKRLQNAVAAQAEIVEESDFQSVLAQLEVQA